MEKIEVEVIKAKNYYKIVRKSDQRHIKSIKTQYVVDLIKEHGSLFIESSSKPLSPRELTRLAVEHYKAKAYNKLESTGQIVMKRRLLEADAIGKKSIYNNYSNDWEYLITFSSGLEVSVSDLHFRMFKSLHTIKKITPEIVQNTLQL